MIDRTPTPDEVYQALLELERQGMVRRTGLYRGDPSDSKN